MVAAHNLLQVLENSVALSKDTGAAVDDLVGEAVLVDVLDDALVVSSGLEPEGRNTKGLGLLKQTTGNL